MASEIVAGESRASQVQAACIAFFVISPIFVALRVWGRVKVRSWSGLSWDDGALLVAWIFTVIMSGLFMSASANGLGQHIADLDVKKVSSMLQSLYVADVFYKLALNLTKVSVLFLYIRRFTTVWFTKACKVMLGIMLAFMIATTITTIAQCTPVALLWDPTIGGTCIDSKAYWYANSAITIITDVILLALPFQPIHASGLPGGQKVALILVFAIGMFTTITSILHMQTINGISSLDDRISNIDPAIWSIIEANLALICGCIPVYRPLLAPIFPAQFSRSTIKPADNRRQTLAPTRSEVSLANRGRRGLGGSKAGDSTADLEKGLDDLPLPPFIKDPNGPPKRSSVLREAYVTLTAVF